MYSIYILKDEYIHDVMLSYKEKKDEENKTNVDTCIDN
jgi:hypothetical protein